MEQSYCKLLKVKIVVLRYKAASYHVGDSRLVVCIAQVLSNTYYNLHNHNYNYNRQRKIQMQSSLFSCAGLKSGCVHSANPAHPDQRDAHFDHRVPSTQSRVKRVSDQNFSNIILAPPPPQMTFFGF